MLTKHDGKLLLALARKSIEAHFSKEKVDLSRYDRFKDKQGAFVTLHKDGELRGCIGFPYPVYPLKDAIFECARAAAFDDPRFHPLDKSELKSIQIEISVLTVPEEMTVKKPEEYLKKIKISEDGLIIKGQYGSGLLLPQVFTEYSCTPEQALEMTCQKAGLSRDSWRSLSNKFSKFQAQIFRE
jgi:AmmeMemoRadiSam system protein A